MNCTAACSNSVSLLLACSVCAGEVWVCQAQRNPWCCDPGERFSPVGEEPAPRQTGEPRAGAQGEKASSEGSSDPPSIRQYFICISSCLSCLIYPGILIKVFIWNPTLCPFSYLCYTASIWLSSAILSNVLDMSVAFQCRVGKSDQELWKSRSLEQSAPFSFPIKTFHVVLYSLTCPFPLSPC